MRTYWRIQFRMTGSVPVTQIWQSFESKEYETLEEARNRIVNLGVTATREFRVIRVTEEVEQ